MAAPSIRLEHFVIKGFRSCRNTTFAPNADLSILIGVNGSGKSNLMQAMLLPKQVSRGRWQKERTTEGPTSEITVGYRAGKQQLNYRALLTYAFDDRGNEEISRSEEMWSLPGVKGLEKWIRIPPGVAHELEFFELSVHAQRWLAHPARRNDIPIVKLLSPDLRPLLQAVTTFQRRTTYYSAALFTDPSRCPNYFEIDNEGALQTSYSGGGRHRQFLYDLYRAYKDKKGEYEEFLEIVGKRGIRLIDGISWREVKVLAREVAVRAGGKIVRKKKEGLLVIPTLVVKSLRLGPNQLSEGTFKSLALLFYLLSDTSPLMLVEEPEVCVHHGLLTSILEVIKSCASRKQIVFSTHSEFVLDTVSPEQVFLVRHTSSAGTQVRELSRSMSARNYAALKQYLNTTGNLGEYVRSGGIAL